VYSFSNLLSYLFMRTDSTFLGVKGQSCHTHALALTSLSLSSSPPLINTIHVFSPFSIQQRPFRATTKGSKEKGRSVVPGHNTQTDKHASTGASSQWPFLLNRFPLPWSPCSSSSPPRPSPATPTCSRTSASRISRPVSSYLNSFFFFVF